MMLRFLQHMTIDKATPTPVERDINILRAKLQFIRDDHYCDGCETDECLICGVLECPEGEPLHFHHDGCPACDAPGKT